MTKTLLLTVSLLTVCLSIHAQKNFPGFYITANGETVNGSFPQFREWKHNPSKVLFETSSKQKVELTPLTCRSFTITGYDTYESAEVRRMTNPTKFEHINTWETGNEAYEVLNVFLRKIYENKAISLYEFSDSKRENYFTKTSDGISELFFKVDYKDGQVIQDRRYAVQLQSIFASNIENNRKLQNKLTRLRYNEKDLVSFLTTFITQPIRKRQELNIPMNLSLPEASLIMQEKQLQMMASLVELQK